MNPNIHARFFGLLKKLPSTSKQDLVWQYSNMLTDSLSEFHQRDPHGYARMIADLQQLANNMEQTEPEKPQQPDQRTTKKLRSGILHRLQKHGVDTTKWACVNSFMENPRIAGKRLYDMSDDEMREFIPKLESILKKDKLYNQEVERQAQLN